VYRQLNARARPGRRELVVRRRGARTRLERGRDDGVRRSEAWIVASSSDLPGRTGSHDVLVRPRRGLGRAGVERADLAALNTAIGGDVDTIYLVVANVSCPLCTTRGCEANEGAIGWGTVEKRAGLHAWVCVPRAVRARCSSCFSRC
jgi:hypothetical protein